MSYQHLSFYIEQDPRGHDTWFLGSEYLILN